MSQVRRSTLAQFVVAVLLAMTAALLPALPASAAPAAPANLTANGTPIPTLRWDPVAGATKYRVQAAEDSSFATTIVDQQTESLSYTPTRVLKGGTLHWRVQAIDSTGTGPWTTTTTTIQQLLQPTGVSVTPNPSLPPVSPPVISWQPVAGATGYDVEMDAEGDNVGGTVKSDIKTSTYVWPDPQGVGERQGTEDFFVRVRARFDNNMQSDWSDYVRYDVAQLPPVTASTCGAEAVCAPHPTTGIRASKTVQDVVFDWDAVKGAKEYEIWVALDRDFNTLVEKKRIISTRYSPATTYDNNNYFWKVRAYNAAGQPAPWPADPNEFQRRWPMSPTLVYPPSGTQVGDDLHYQWTPVRHATRYALEVSPNANFTPGTFKRCVTQATTYTPGFIRDECRPPTQGVTTYWRVQALDLPFRGGVNGIYSATGQFRYTTDQVRALAPANGALVDVPTLRWDAVQDTERYRVTLKSLTTGDVVSTTTSALSWTPTSPLSSDSDRDDPARNPDHYEWSVEAIKSAGQPSPRWVTGTFYLREAPVPAGASPLAALPQHQPVSSRFPSLSWQAYPSTVDAPVYYRLVVAEAGSGPYQESVTPILSTKINYPAVTDANEFFLKPMTYTWRVDAYDANTNARLAVGPSSSFTITAPDAVAGNQIALDGRALDNGDTCIKRLVVGNEETVCRGLPSTPVLDWEPVKGAGGYMVYIAEDPDFTQMVLDPTRTATSNSRWTPTTYDAKHALADNESGPAYYWFIRPCTRITPFVNCGPGPAGRLDSGTNAFRKVSPAVELTSPADQAILADEVTFTWKDYHLTNQATRASYAAGGAPSYQTAMSYRLQVARTPEITSANAIDDVTVDQTTYTATNKTYPEGDLWWRVQAIDSNGNSLKWSATRKVVKATPALNLDPNTAAPRERATVDPGARPAFNSRQSSGPVLFTWSAHDMDATWELEVYRNDDITGSTGSRVFSARLSQAAHVNTSVIPPSDSAYRWRVRRIDVSGNPGPWSDYGRFFVDPAPVTLNSPPAGATLLPNGVALTWQPYAAGNTQAAKYEVDIEPVDGGNNPSPVTTAATAWSPYVALRSGTYTWTVKAYDASGGLLGASETRRFTVDGGLGVVAPAAIAAPNGTGVGSTLTSTPPRWSQPDVAMTYQWLRAGRAIRGATSDTYVLTVDDVQAAITLQVTGRKAGFTDAVSVSNALTGTAGSALTTTVAPIITGTAKPGESLAVSSGTWSVARPRVSYQWLRNGSPIAGATSNRYKLVPSDAVTDVSVLVTASSSGFADGKVTTAAVRVAKNPSTTEAKLSASTIKRSKRAKLTITVTVPGVAKPTGVLLVKVGKKTVKKIRLKPKKKGKVTFKLPKLKPKKHKIKVIYRGNATIAKSKSKRVVLKVTR